jgi:L-cysteine desulfidase
LYIKAEAVFEDHRAEAVIEKLHNNIVSRSLDGRPAQDSSLLGSADLPDQYNRDHLEAWLKGLSLQQLIDLIDDLDAEDLAFIDEGLSINQALSEYGLKHGSGLGVGRTLERLARQKLIARDMILSARMLASSAADARMAGVKLPAMSSAGSGNHGLTAVLPIAAVRDHVDCDHQSLLESMALSHLVTAHIKAYTGRLSAVCGCSIAAGAGAAAGVAHLLGGNTHHVAGAITNLIEDLAGVICDGAKLSCAFKLSTAAGTAVQAALFALQGIVVQPTDGIIGASIEQTTRNIGALSTQGMVETDRTILKIMLEKRFVGY